MLAELGTELLIIIALTLANGFFAGSEIAIVSARRSRLEAQANAGRQAARRAISLAENPDRFLATVQVGITLIGTFSAAFGGARIGDLLAAWFQDIPALAPYAESLALGLVVIGITYLSLILGELVPKRLALRRAEQWALIAAPVMHLLAQVARPVVAFLTFSVSALLRLLGLGVGDESAVTEEDIVYMVRKGRESGSVEAGEAYLIQQVFQATDRPVRAVMTPRTEMVTIEAHMSLAEISQVFFESRYSRLPVYEDRIDNIIGVLHVKNVLHWMIQPDGVTDLRELFLPVTFVYEAEPVQKVLAGFRRMGVHMAMVLDEYGQTAGLVTLEDLLEELVGEIQDEYDRGEEHPIFRRADGSWLVDGLEAVDKVRQRVGLPELEELEGDSFTSLAGMILALLDRIPQEGDTVRVGDFILEVVDMDGRRIDKVLIRPAPPPPAEQP